MSCGMGVRNVKAAKVTFKVSQIGWRRKAVVVKTDILEREGWRVMEDDSKEKKSEREVGKGFTDEEVFFPSIQARWQPRTFL